MKKWQRITKKWVAMLLTLTMCMSLFTAPAFAEENGLSAPEQTQTNDVTQPESTINPALDNTNQDSTPATIQDGNQPSSENTPVEDNSQQNAASENGGTGHTPENNTASENQQTLAPGSADNNDDSEQTEENQSSDAGKQGGTPDNANTGDNSQPSGNATNADTKPEQPDSPSASTAGDDQSNAAISSSQTPILESSNSKINVVQNSGQIQQDAMLARTQALQTAASPSDPSVTIEATVDKTEVAPGDTITYNIVVKHHHANGKAAQMICIDHTLDTSKFESINVSNVYNYLDGLGYSLSWVPINSERAISIVAKVKDDIAPGTAIDNIITATYYVNSNDKSTVSSDTMTTTVKGNATRAIPIKQITVAFSPFYTGKDPGSVTLEDIPKDFALDYSYTDREGEHSGTLHYEDADAKFIAAQTLGKDATLRWDDPFEIAIAADEPDDSTFTITFTEHNYKIGDESKLIWQDTTYEENGSAKDPTKMEVVVENPNTTHAKNLFFYNRYAKAVEQIPNTKLNVTKSVDKETVKPGDTINYQIGVTNITSHGFTVNFFDELDENLELISAKVCNKAPFIYFPQEQQLSYAQEFTDAYKTGNSYQFQAPPRQSTATVFITAKVKDDVKPGTVIKNIARASWEGQPTTEADAISNEVTTTVEGTTTYVKTPVSFEVAFIGIEREQIPEDYSLTYTITNPNVEGFELKETLKRNAQGAEVKPMETESNTGYPALRWDLILDLPQSYEDASRTSGNVLHGENDVVFKEDNAAVVGYYYGFGDNGEAIENARQNIGNNSERTFQITGCTLGTTKNLFSAYLVPYAAYHFYYDRIGYQEDGRTQLEEWLGSPTTLGFGTSFTPQYTPAVFSGEEASLYAKTAYPNHPNEGKFLLYNKPSSFIVTPSTNRFDYYYVRAVTATWLDADNEQIKQITIAKGSNAYKDQYPTDPSESGKWQEPVIDEKGNITIKWLPDSFFTVTWLDGYTSTPIHTASYSKQNESTKYESEYPANPTRLNFDFVDWGEPVKDANGNITITALWNPLPDTRFTVTWLNGYDNTPVKFASYSKQNQSEQYRNDYPAAPNRAGFNFTRWGDPVTDADGNITITAQWQPIGGGESGDPIVDPTPTPDPGDYPVYEPTPTPTPTPVTTPPETTLPESDVPLAELPNEEATVEEIADTEVPLAELPAPVEEVVLAEEDIPLADVPKTGDNALLWLLVAMLSGMGGLALSVKKRGTVK